MNNQTEQGREPQYIINLENILGSVEQVVNLLHCFIDFAEDEGREDDALSFEDRSLNALGFIRRLDSHLSMIYVGAESLDNSIAVLNDAITAIQSERWNKKAVQA